MLDYIAIASGLIATTYGHGETFCGDVDKPVACAFGAITASGEVFDPTLPTVAVPAPFNKIMRPKDIWLQIEDGPCVKLRVNDKKNPRYIFNGGFDLTPAAVKALTGKKATKFWSGRVYVCKMETV